VNSTDIKQQNVITFITVLEKNKSKDDNKLVY